MRPAPTSLKSIFDELCSHHSYLSSADDTTVSKSFTKEADIGRAKLFYIKKPDVEKLSITDPYGSRIDMECPPFKAILSMNAEKMEQYLRRWNGLKSIQSTFANEKEDSGYIIHEFFGLTPALAMKIVRDTYNL